MLSFEANKNINNTIFMICQQPLDLCDTYNISNHLLCCKSDHYRILPDCVLKPSNVAIPFDASSSSPSSSSSKLISYSATTTLHEGIYALPTIRFTGKVVKKNIQIPMQIVAMERFNRSKCSAYFNGTLHIVGRHIPNNLYHFCKSLLPC